MVRNSSAASYPESFKKSPSRTWSEAGDEQLRSELDRKFREAVAVAEKTPQPPLASMHEHVYAKPSWNLLEQRAALLAGPRPFPHP